MMMRTAAVVASAAVIGAAAQDDNKLVSGVWNGYTWEYVMNRVPNKEHCNAALGSCSPRSMWHKFGYNEYYAVGVKAAADSPTGMKEGKMNFTEAKAFCANIAAQVVTINTEEESDFVISLIENNRHGFWLGLERTHGLFDKPRSAKGFAFWIDGTPVHYTKWGPGEPNSKRVTLNPKDDTEQIEDIDQYIDACAFQGFNKGDPSVWNDVNCGKRRRVVCERALINPYPENERGNLACNGQVDPVECEDYYSMRCLDVFGYPSTIGGADNAYDKCPIKCASCITTTTTMETTSTTWATTSTTWATTSTTWATTSTTWATTSTTWETTTTTFETTSTTFETTSTTFDTSTTTGTTTTFDTTTTTMEPTTETFDLGPCQSRPHRGWRDHVRGGGIYETYEVHCCYKYQNKPRLNFDDAKARCEGFSDEYPMRNAWSSLAAPWDPEINDFLINDIMLQKPYFDNCNNSETDCRNSSQAETSWIGGKVMPNSDGDVTWTSNYWNMGMNTTNYGANGTWPYFFDGETNPNNGMFYPGEPSNLNMQFGNQGRPEECLSVGGARTEIVREHGFKGWNDAKCDDKKGFFCEFCVKVATTTTTEAPSTTTTVGPTTTTTAAPTTTTTVGPTTTTTVGPTTTTTVGPTTSTTEAPSTTTFEPTTTTTAEPDCESIACADECGAIHLPPKQQSKDYEPSFCGWSKKKGKCIQGGRTTEKELGMCNTDLIRTTVTEKPKSIEEICAAIYCSIDCVYGFDGGAGPVPCKENMMLGTTCDVRGAACGWSRKKNKCIPGALTNAMESTTALGPKCF